MAIIWTDRLAEVWAEPGKAGAGVVIGAATVLTARHVVAGALDRGRVQARVIRPGALAAEWVPMTVLADDAEWDVALLGVGDGNAGAGDSTLRWVEPSSPPPVFVQLKTSVEHDCEAVGFPQAEVQHAPDASPVTTVRQSEHAVGMLLPAGQAKRPVNAQRPLPKRWIPFDVKGSTPGAQAGWGGMSGAGVVLPDGRLAGLVVSAEAGHQQRRLYVVPLADVLADSTRIAQTLAAVLDSPVIIEVRDAPLWRDVLQDGCLGPAGFPVLVGEASYRAFGVKPADVPGEPAFLEYVPRDADQKLQDGLLTAQAEHRLLLVVGGSAGGKSRSAAEAVRLRMPGHRLLCPRHSALGRLLELPLADLVPALVWLDDAEQYNQRVFRDDIERLLRSGVAVVATIRRSVFEAMMPEGDLRNPFGDALNDSELAVAVNWPVTWNDQERQRVREHVRYPALLAWVAAGKSPSAWAVAGPALQDRLRAAETDDEWPARYALIRAVLDWYRTGIAQPMPLAAAVRLVQAYLPVQAEPAEIEDALRWALTSVTGASPRTTQSLLARTTAADAVGVHDYIQDADARAGTRLLADAMWTAALDGATSDGAAFAIGHAAARQGNVAVASKCWLPLARSGDTTAMLNLGVLLQDRDPAQARRWYERAAEAGDTLAMLNLGVLLRARASDPAEARQWYERAAEAGNTFAMINLGTLLAAGDPAQARQWYERAAEAGNTLAMVTLGRLLEDRDPAQARQWYERAAEAGDNLAMRALGALLENDDPAQARQWYERAADTGDTSAMFILGTALLKDGDLAHARQWYEQAAEAGHTAAMFGLGTLLQHSDPAQARQWLERAAEAGLPAAMYTLGVLLADGDPAQARQWYERAADAGDSDAMFTLGTLLQDGDPDRARQWYEGAAEAGHADAMFNLGVLLEDGDPDRARQWYERAAEAGNTVAMINLGTLLQHSDPAQARQWYERAAELGLPLALTALGTLLDDSDPVQARQWYEQAADAGEVIAMYNLGTALLREGDADGARQWYERAAEAGLPLAMTALGALLEDDDPAGVVLSGEVSPDLAQWLRGQIETFHQYLAALGLEPYEREPPRIGLEPEVPGSFYDPATHQIEISPELADNRHIVFREYCNYALSPDDISEELAIAAYDLKSGLGFYFPCSFTGDSEGFSPFGINLDDTRQMNRRRGRPGPGKQPRAYIWASIFWEARQLLDPRVADKLIADVWLETVTAAYKSSPPADKPHRLGYRAIEDQFIHRMHDMARAGLQPEGSQALAELLIKRHLLAAEPPTAP